MNTVDRFVRSAATTAEHGMENGFGSISIRVRNAAVTGQARMEFEQVGGLILLAKRPTRTPKLTRHAFYDGEAPDGVDPDPEVNDAAGGRSRKKGK